MSTSAASSRARPTISRTVLQQRSDLLAGLRDFFRARGLLEVDTPLLYPAAPAEPGLHAFPVEMPDGDTWYLQTSPEFPLKRLLAVHPVGIYQLGHVFRRGENGRIHNSEFSMLEWYRPGFSLVDLRGECIELLTAMLGSKPVCRSSFGELFRAHVGLDPVQATTGELRELAATCAGPEASVHRDQCVDLLFEERVRPALDAEALTIVHGFPAGQSTLVQVEEDAFGRCCESRFEIFHRGMELVNAAAELRDGREYRHRVHQQNALRRERHLKSVAADESLAAVLEDLPICAGAALGVDRLLMCATGAQSIAEVMPLSQDLL